MNKRVKKKLNRRMGYRTYANRYKDFFPEHIKYWKQAAVTILFQGSEPRPPENGGGLIDLEPLKAIEEKYNQATNRFLVDLLSPYSLAPVIKHYDDAMEAHEKHLIDLLAL